MALGGSGHRLGHAYQYELLWYASTRSAAVRFVTPGFRVLASLKCASSSRSGNSQSILSRSGQQIDADGVLESERTCIHGRRPWMVVRQNTKSPAPSGVRVGALFRRAGSADRRGMVRAQRRAGAPRRGWRPALCLPAR
ncbi:hypothetical protein C791_8386 [Amycolatopsis azurea DSM 43854]|uniref:Uncharacterized protein n=1 Tax=Amycolatopsis azurea DSM 43854 TaxID=1238180 RepID=M2NK59_9PSEU|nr:hypothetical protein C791_8386 [Amycolatopsis azurea DSM 43854]